MSVAFRTFLLYILSVPVVVAAQPAPKPVVFSKQVLPLLREQCWSCHSGMMPTSGYSLETRDKMLAGGRHGPAILMGKGKESALVRYLSGEIKPSMPPQNPLDMDQIALIRRWIDEGAKVDSYSYTVPKTLPKRPTKNDQRQTILAAAPVTAVSFSPEGKTLAAGGYRKVRLLDPATGSVIQTLTGIAGQVQALAWSSDKKYLAAAGGIPGEKGEVVLFDLATGKIARTLGEHTEVVHAVAFSPDSKILATGSLDKTARLWEVTTGKLLRTIKDHADAVNGVDFSPDGKYLATGSSDRTAKIFQTSDWQRVATLNAHQDVVTCVAFSPDSKRLATAGADKTLRVWQVEIGKMDNPQHTHSAGDLITDCAFSPDGQLLLFSSADRIVRAYNGDGSQHRHDLRDAEDWVYSVAASPDGSLVAAGTQDGRVYFWEPKEWKLVRVNHGGKEDKNHRTTENTESTERKR